MLSFLALGIMKELINQPLTQSIVVDGVTRHYLLDVPQNLERGAGLILVCHGFGDSPESIREYSGLYKQDASKHFVLAYPEGTKDKAGKRNFQVGYAFQDPKINDVRFASELVNHLIRKYHLNRRDVFCTGMSNGADFSYYLARQPHPIVRAIAPVAGAMMVAWNQTLHAKNRIPIMAVHGTDDEVTLWKGDLANHDGWGPYLGTDEMVKWWVDSLKLTHLDRKSIFPGDASGNGAIDLKRWHSDHDECEYRLYTIQGGKHVWPEHLGNPSIPLAQTILDFFESTLKSGR